MKLETYGQVVDIKFLIVILFVGRNKVSELYHYFKASENKGSSESAEVSVRNESSHDRQQESCSHKVCKCICSGRQIEEHHQHKIQHHANHVCQKSHVLQSHEHCNMQLMKGD